MAVIGLVFPVGDNDHIVRGVQGDAMLGKQR